jgi:hypothetical protein
MKWSNYGRCRLLLCVVLFCAAFLCCTSLGAQAQTSTSNLPIVSVPTQLSEPLWQTLYPSIMSLPTTFQNFRDSLLSQVSSLQGTMFSLQQDNGYLTESQTILEGLVVTSQSKLTRLQTDLADCTNSITLLQSELSKAKIDAKGLEAQTSILKVGCITFGVAAGAGAAYLFGHSVLHWW